jgi:hypothetical protein
VKIRDGIISNKGKLVFIVVICAISLTSNSDIFGQNSSEDVVPDTSSNHSQIILSKIATGNTTIRNNSVFVGEFNANYSIFGTPIDIKHSKELIISSIVDDLTKSPTAGYVMASKSKSNTSDMSGIANPFTSNEQINQKIQSILGKAIDGATISDTDLVEVQCSFGNVLNAFSCASFP